MTVRNLTVQRTNQDGTVSSLTCQMLDHETGEWFRQDIDVTPDTAFERLSNWNSKYDTAEVKASSAAMIKDILDNQAFYGCGF